MKQSIKQETISIDNKIVGKVDINGFLAYYSIGLTAIIVMFFIWSKYGNHIKSGAKKITKRKNKK